MRLRFVSDRGQRSIDIGFSSKPDEWFDFSLVKAWLNNEDVMEGSFSYEDMISFLRGLNRRFRTRSVFHAVVRIILCVTPIKPLLI